MGWHFDLYFTDLYFIQNGAQTSVRYRDEILDVCGAVGDNFALIDNNARPHMTWVANGYLEDEVIECLDWPSRSPDPNPIEIPGYRHTQS